jgi:hypothetical protein
MQISEFNFQVVDSTEVKQTILVSKQGENVGVTSEGGLIGRVTSPACAGS